MPPLPRSASGPRYLVWALGSLNSPGSCRVRCIVWALRRCPFFSPLHIKGPYIRTLSRRLGTTLRALETTLRRARKADAPRFRALGFRVAWQAGRYITTGATHCSSQHGSIAPQLKSDKLRNVGGSLPQKDKSGCAVDDTGQGLYSPKPLHMVSMLGSINA